MLDRIDPERADQCDARERSRALFLPQYLIWHEHDERQSEDHQQNRDQRVSDAMMAAWVRFAETGDPNGAGAPHWAPYDAARDNYLAFGTDLAEGTRWRAEPLAFIERFYAARA